MADDSTFFLAILAHATDSILLINRSGIVMMAAHERDSHLAGRDVREAIGRSHRRRFQAAVDQVIESAAPVTCEARGSVATDRSAWLSCRLSPVADGDKVASILVFIADIADQRVKQSTGTPPPSAQNRSVDRGRREYPDNVCGN